MILVDTSIWIEHLRSGYPELERCLGAGRVLGHPWVTGELALGHLDQREAIVALLHGLPQAEVATPSEVLALSNGQRLYGTGIGYVDAQLIAATMITAEASMLWTADRRLGSAASELGYAYVEAGS